MFWTLTAYISNTLISNIVVILSQGAQRGRRRALRLFLTLTFAFPLLHFRNVQTLNPTIIDDLHTNAPVLSRLEW